MDTQKKKNPTKASKVGKSKKETILPLADEHDNGSGGVGRKNINGKNTNGKNTDRKEQKASQKKPKKQKKVVEDVNHEAGVDNVGDVDNVENVEDVEDVKEKESPVVENDKNDEKNEENPEETVDLSTEYVESKSNRELIFTSIKELLADLSIISRLPGVILYNQILSKTEFENEHAVLKNIGIFESFFRENENAIYSLNEKTFVTDKISYSEKVKVHIVQILSSVSPSDKRVVWKHILTIFALLFSKNRKVRKILGEYSKEVHEKKETKENEEDLIGEMLQELEKGMGTKPDSSPSDIIGHIAKSGFVEKFTSKLTDGVDNGSFDIGKMLSSVKVLIGKISDGEEDPQAQVLTNAVGNIASSVETAQQGGQIDPMGLMTTFMGIIPSLSGNSDGKTDK